MERMVVEVKARCMSEKNRPRLCTSLNRRRREGELTGMEWSGWKVVGGVGVWAKD